jgi:Carbonic anhydrase
MSELDSMLERNKNFAARQSAVGKLMPSLPQALPNVRAIIIGCADMRVDPAHVLGIEPGEAVVIRNIGGRITPGLLEQLGLLGRIGEVAGKIPGRLLPSMLLCSGRFPQCRETGSSPALSMTWQPDLWRSPYRRRGFVSRKHGCIKIR